MFISQETHAQIKALNEIAAELGIPPISVANNICDLAIRAAYIAMMAAKKAANPSEAHDGVIYIPDPARETSEMK